MPQQDNEEQSIYNRLLKKHLPITKKDLPPIEKLKPNDKKAAIDLLAYKSSADFIKEHEKEFRAGLSARLGEQLGDAVFLCLKNQYDIFEEKLALQLQLARLVLSHLESSDEDLRVKAILALIILFDHKIIEVSMLHLLEHNRLRDRINAVSKLNQIFEKPSISLKDFNKGPGFNLIKRF